MSATGARRSAAQPHSAGASQNRLAVAALRQGARFVAAAAACIALTLTGCSRSPMSTAVPSGSGGDVSEWAVAAGTCDTAPAVKVRIGTRAPATVQTQDLCLGSGETISTQTTITAHYIIAILRNGKVITSTWSAGAPINTQVSNTVKGWKQGIKGMKVHGRRLIVIPPAAGYGSAPPPATPIQPGDTLVLLLQIENAF